MVKTYMTGEPAQAKPLLNLLSRNDNKPPISNTDAPNKLKPGSLRYKDALASKEQFS